MSKRNWAAGIEVENIEAPLSLGDYRLVAFDMDSTLITTECVDEIAGVVGKKAEVSAITEAAMQGRISDYKESLRQRVALLQGVTLEQLAQVYNQRVQLTEGAEILVRACQQAGLKTLLVTGGFCYFASRIRERLALDFMRANQLEIQDGVLTGRMQEQCWGDICDGQQKRRAVLDLASLMGIGPAQVMAIGDGANDLPMMEAVGLSVAFHAKPAVRARARVEINEGGLERLLELVRP